MANEMAVIIASGLGGWGFFWAKQSSCFDADMMALCIRSEYTFC
jgi:hypothetical protein